MSKNWFIRSKLNGNLFGPYPVDLLKTYIAQGRIDANYTVSSNKKHWQEISDWAASDKKKLGKYEIIRELGRGGMGAVYLAYDPNLQRNCAVKVMLNNDDTDALKRFQIEAKAVAQIKHPNIIHIYDICEEPHHFFVMDYIEGVPLDEYLIRLSIQQKVQIFAKICDAIAFAHERNILHRDLKPANILVRHDGEPIIVDFGLAKNIQQQDNLTKTGDVFGTPKYMAPEMTQGQFGTPQVDVYSLGVILYEMLTGRVPFDGENSLELLYQLTMADPIPPSKLNSSIPKEGDLETICLRALEKSPENRIASVQFLHREIKCFLSGKPIRLKPPTNVQKTLKWLNKHRTVIAVSSIALIVIGITIGVYLWGIAIQNHKTRFQDKMLTLRSTRALAQEKKKSIDTYLSSKNHDQFFHLSVKEQMQNLKDKINGEIEIYDIYNYIEKNYPPNYTQENFSDKDEKDEIERELKKRWPLRDRETQLQKNKDYYRQLDSKLRFSVLPNFPRKTHYHFTEDSELVCVSEKNKYIAQKTTSGQWLLWQRPFDKLSLATATKIDDIPVGDDDKCTFSDDETLFVVETNRHLYFWDLTKKRIVFSHRGRMEHIAFHRHFVAFVTYTNTQSFMNIYDRKRKTIVEKFLTNYLIFTDFSEDFFVVVHQQKISTFDVKKQKTRHHDIPTSSIRQRVDLDRRHNELVFLSRLSVSIFNIATAKMRTFPFEFSSSTVSSTKKSFININHSQIAFVRDSGEVIISYLSQLSTDKVSIIASKRLIPSSDENVRKLAFAPQYFLGVFKTNSVELINTQNGSKIITIDYDTRDKVDGQLTSFNNGLMVSMMTKKDYKEYFFPLKKYSVDDNLKRVIQRFMRIYTTGGQIAQDIFITKNFMVYTSWMGFLIWKDGKFFGYRKIYKSPEKFKLSPKNDYMTVRYRASEIHLYETQNFKRISSDILGKTGRYFLNSHSQEMREISSATFAKDGKHLFLSRSNLQLFKYNLETKKITKICRDSWDGSVLLLDMMQSHDDYIVVGFSEHNGQKGGYAVFTPERRRTIHKTEDAVCAINIHQQYFVVALENGVIRVYDFRSPKKKIMEFRCPGKPQRVLFSPNGEYVAAFTAHDTYIFDIKTYNLEKDNYFKIYNGHYKNHIGTFRHDWKKAYFTNNSGDVLVFDQEFFVDEDAYEKRLQQQKNFLSNDFFESREKLKRILKQE
ncbi:serine/threonine-protein kinase [Candidatus Uabimicrobium amorphum]|uniref:Protein kinase n=1 Tax=Uabimicrobium amorphum TaxID=2596890 RepID=A0A5S9IME7_UABAM|nr:serine/threonine-protein kinase [Candidatus Uabimicrobium amorphum]BBM84116.1 protein kinase [Candidatus Uabimicrobium amorphum]